MPESPEPLAVPHVLISPRHLAGGGESSLVTDHLRTHGWRDLSQPGRLHAHLESPDGALRLRLEPDPDHPWWTVLGTPAGQAPWHASFDARTPAETILAFAQALTHPDDAPANDPLQSLAEAGWIPGIGQRSLHKRHSPDQLAAWDLRNHDGATAWVATCRIHGQTLWHAAFSARAPLPVVTAFVTSLADSRPLPRRPEAVPPLARTYTASRPATSTQPALPPQLAKPPSPGRTR